MRNLINFQNGWDLPPLGQVNIYGLAAKHSGTSKRLVSVVAVKGQGTFAEHGGTCKLRLRRPGSKQGIQAL